MAHESPVDYIRESPMPPEPVEFMPGMYTRARVAREIGPIAVLRTISGPVLRAWERVTGQENEIPISPDAQWAEDVATQDGFRREDAPRLAYDHLRSRYHVPDATETELTTLASHDLARLQHTEIVVDKYGGRNFLKSMTPVDLFAQNAWRTANIAAILEAGITPSQYLHMDRRERHHLDRSLAQRARALQGTFLHDTELAAAFDRYTDYLAPKLTPRRRKELGYTYGRSALKWVLANQVSREEQ